MVDVIRELTEEDFARAMPRKQRERIMRGRVDPLTDIVALRRFADLTQLLHFLYAVCASCLIPLNNLTMKNATTPTTNHKPPFVSSATP